MVVVGSSIILHRIPQILHRSGSVASFAIAGAITNITTLVIMNTIATLAIASSSLVSLHLQHNVNSEQNKEKTEPRDEAIQALLT
jgi:malate synthase